MLPLAEVMGYARGLSLGVVRGSQRFNKAIVFFVYIGHALNSHHTTFLSETLMVKVFHLKHSDFANVSLSCQSFISLSDT